MQAIPIRRRTGMPQKVTEAQLNDIVPRLIVRVNEHQGQIMGLVAVIATILKKNPSIQMDENEIGKTIAEFKGGSDVDETRNIARDIMNTIRAFSGR